ncbi:MAG: lamin tail domain-containing protein, partial [Candidatus Cloacimonetes bacterium]|nr:lamin tail domain-containing protein [Candidatus Cloacimonadota bacterium]
GATQVDKSISGTVISPPPPDAPTANNATAISHEGFTARWNAVSGANSYRLDVLQGSPAVATDLFISEYVEGSSYNKAIEIYNGTGSVVNLSNYSLKKQTNGSGDFGDELTLSGTLSNNDVYVIVSNAGTPNLSAQLFVDLATGSQALNFNGNDAVALYKSGTQIDVVGVVDNAANWGKDVTLVRKSTVTAPTTSYSVGDWDSNAIDTFSYLGSHTMGSAATPVSGYNDLTVSGTIKRVSGLSESTDYTYRVRAVNSNGTSSNSNIIDVSTTATTSGAGANTAIGGASTVVTIPALPAFTNNSVEIDPDISSNDDFTVTVAEIATGITYTVFSSNNLALNGTYLLNHAGFSAAPDLTASVGSLSVDASDADASIVTISGINGKGDLVITAEGESTLPVELSSFTATMTVQNTVNLMWVTQSETNVNGYYVHRGVSTELTGAEVVSPLILASNTSQQHYYQFTDSDIYETGTYYYWLEAQDLDGTTAYHGPITLQYNNNNNTPPTIPLTTELKTVYPNPFNPSTTISYGLSKQAAVSFTIYNARGQVVRSFNEGTKAAGNHNILWNGIDNNGRICGTGVYFINMQAGKDSFIRKAVLMK